jgi:CheY-like chemotaxis protein
MTSSNTHDSTGAGLSNDLSGLEILLVEDSWVVGEAVKDLLELLGADVVGPAASTAEAERLLSGARSGRSPRRLPSPRGRTVLQLDRSAA